MIIKFTYNDEVYTHELRNKIIKIYEVPKSYSEDGLYISDFSKELKEPIPNCMSSEATLLYHADVRKVLGEEFMREYINIIGEVEYAKS
jgi:hypothetical protein